MLQKNVAMSQLFRRPKIVSRKKNSVKDIWILNQVWNLKDTSKHSERGLP